MKNQCHDSHWHIHISTLNIYRLTYAFSNYSHAGVKRLVFNILVLRSMFGQLTCQSLRAIPTPMKGNTNYQCRQRNPSQVVVSLVQQEVGNAIDTVKVHIHVPTKTKATDQICPSTIETMARGCSRFLRIVVSPNSFISSIDYRSIHGTGFKFLITLPSIIDFYF